MSKNAHLGVAGVIRGVDGEDPTTNGKGSGQEPEPACNWTGRGVKNDVVTAVGPATGVTGGSGGVKGASSSGPSVGNISGPSEKPCDNDVRKTRPTISDGDGDGTVGDVVAGKEFVKEVVSEESCEPAASNTDVVESSSIAESVEDVSSRSITKMIIEDLPKEKASARRVGDGDTGGVKSRASGDSRGEYSAIDTSLGADRKSVV